MTPQLHAWLACVIFPATGIFPLFLLLFLLLFWFWLLWEDWLGWLDWDFGALGLVESCPTNLSGVGMSGAGGIASCGYSYSRSSVRPPAGPRVLAVFGVSPLSMLVKSQVKSVKFSSRLHATMHAYDLPLHVWVKYFGTVYRLLCTTVV